MAITHYLRTKNDDTLDRIDEPHKGMWVVVEDPTEAEQELLLSEYLIEPDVLHDALDIHEVPRIEKVDEITLVIITRIPIANEETETIITVPFTIVIGDSYVMTISRTPQSELIAAVKNSVITTQRTHLLFTLLSAITRLYMKEITVINREVRRQTVQLADITAHDLVHLVHHERSLNDYLDALQPMNVVLETLLTGKMIKMYPDDKEIVEDLSLSEEQLITRSKALLRTIQNIRDAYGAIMNAKLNETVKKLTLVTVVLTIPTMIAGLFGMNVPIPIGQNYYGFGIILIFAGALSVGVYHFLRKRV